jgi:hypothetical protein
MALHERNRRPARAHDDLDRLVIERVLFSGRLSINADRALFATRGSSTSPMYSGCREALQVLDDLVHLVIGDERAVHALRQPGAGGRYSMSPAPSSASAPDWSRIVRESTLDDTWNAMRAGMFALMRPVITSTDGLCVARIEVNARGARLLRQPGDQSSTFFLRPSSGPQVRR